MKQTKYDKLNVFVVLVVMVVMINYVSIHFQCVNDKKKGKSRYNNYVIKKKKTK